MNSLIRQALFTTRANTLRFGQTRLMSQEGGSNKKELVITVLLVACTYI